MPIILQPWDNTLFHTKIDAQVSVSASHCIELQAKNPNVTTLGREIADLCDTPLTKRFRNDHLSMSLKVFSLPLAIGPTDRGLQFSVATRDTMSLPALGLEPTSPVLLGECLIN